MRFSCAHLYCFIWPLTALAGTVKFGGVLTITLPLDTIRQNNQTELTLVTYNNHTGTFESVVVLIDGETCETLIAEPQYGLQSFSVVLTPDRSTCKKTGISKAAIIAIAVTGVIIALVVVALLIVVFVFPEAIRRRPRARSRREMLSSVN